MRTFLRGHCPAKGTVTGEPAISGIILMALKDVELSGLAVGTNGISLRVFHSINLGKAKVDQVPA
jgi:hypothetical protein